MENTYSNVGAIMVWQVDDSGRPVQLRAFASGTLIRPRVIVTAGHFTAPTKALEPFSFPCLRVLSPWFFGASCVLGASSLVQLRTRGLWTRERTKDQERRPKNSRYVDLKARSGT